MIFLTSAWWEVKVIKVEMNVHGFTEATSTLLETWKSAWQCLKNSNIMLFVMDHYTDLHKFPWYQQTEVGNHQHTALCFCFLSSEIKINTPKCLTAEPCGPCDDVASKLSPETKTARENRLSSHPAPPQGLRVMNGRYTKGFQKYSRHSKHEFLLPCVVLHKALHTTSSSTNTPHFSSPKHTPDVREQCRKIRLLN